MTIQRAYICDCRVDISHDPQGVIRYCPTHRAAPALLEAMETMEKALHSMTDADKCEMAACIMAHAAIKAARGEAAGTEGGRG